MLYPAQLRAQFRLTTYVETGCFLGRSLRLAQQAGFGDLLSCDICERYVLQCRKRFPGARIVHGDSLSMLRRCLPTRMGGPALFWLDAHFPATFGLPETAANRYPLPHELELIRTLRRGWQHDVIAMDDLRVIRDRRNPRWRPGELRGRHAACYQDITLAELCQPFQATHEIALLQQAEGVALFLPRA